MTAAMFYYVIKAIKIGIALCKNVIGYSPYPLNCLKLSVYYLHYLMFVTFPTYLFRHLIIHGIKFECNVCGKVCTSQKSLDIHKREKHGMVKEWSMPPTQHLHHHQQQQLHQQQLQQQQTPGTNTIMIYCCTSVIIFAIFCHLSKILKVFGNICLVFGKILTLFGKSLMQLENFSFLKW